MKYIWIACLWMCFSTFAYSLEYPPYSQVTTLGACCELQATVKFRYGIKPKSTARLTYPILATNDETDFSFLFNEGMEDFLEREVTSFRERSKADPVDHRHFLSVDYSTSAFRLKDHTIISLRFSLLEALQHESNRNLTFRSMNFNLKTGAWLSLDQLFSDREAGLMLISEYVKDSLSARVKDDAVIRLEGLTPTEEHFSVWNMLPSGIMFTFARGEVLPASFGTQTVLIPYDVFDGYLNSDSPFEQCAKRPRSCRQTLAMSGGFSEFKAAGS